MGYLLTVTKTRFSILEDLLASPLTYIILQGRCTASMQKRLVFVTYEDEVAPLRIARQGSTGTLTLRKLMDPEDTGSVSGTVLVAEAKPHQEPITPHAHKEVEESLYIIKGEGRVTIGPSTDNLQTFPLRPGACIYVPANYYHIIEVEGEVPMKLVISYFPTDKRGRSHREIATDLTNVPLEGEYGTTE